MAKCALGFWTEVCKTGLNPVPGHLIAPYIEWEDRNYGISEEMGQFGFIIFPKANIKDCGEVGGALR